MPRLAPRIAELVERYSLPDPATGHQLAQLLAALSEDPHAPTAIRDPERVLDDHLADSLVALELEPVRSAGSIVDVGAGAGLPGLPLAIALPKARFILLESVGRRCSFLERAAVACSLANVEVEHARAENYGRHAFDLALARALGPLAVVLEYAAPLLALDGHLVVWRGRRDGGDEAAAERAAETLGLHSGGIRRVRPYPEARERHLHLFLKVRPTPERFPRRPGMALKHPLGGS